jgi:hypothetical protein
MLTSALLDEATCWTPERGPCVVRRGGASFLVYRYDDERNRLCIAHALERASVGKSFQDWKTLTPTDVHASSLSHNALEKAHDERIIFSALVSMTGTHAGVAACVRTEFERVFLAVPTFYATELLTRLPACR